MLLVTGPVTRNMELALGKTYAATPDPKIVVAVGACGISGGIFGLNYASLGGVDAVIPVDVYVPGCPPRPEALLHGIPACAGQAESRQETQRPRFPRLIACKVNTRAHRCRGYASIARSARSICASASRTAVSSGKTFWYFLMMARARHPFPSLA